MAYESTEKKDSLTVEDVRTFIAQAKKKSENFVTIADRSWREIEKQQRDGRLYGGNDLDRKRKNAKYPLWWTCWQIKRSLILARLPVPVLKDTQGNDPFGRTACVIGERFTRAILKTFDPFPEFAAANDDFIVTNFAWGCWYYCNTIEEEDEKLRLQMIELPPEMNEMGEPDGPPTQAFMLPDGTMTQEQPLFDDIGPYLLSGQKVSVNNEEVYFRTGLYSALHIDPNAVRWAHATRLAMEFHSSYREFKEEFGQAALDKLKRSDIEDHRVNGKPIIWYVYYDKLSKEIRWLAENSEDFFQPKKLAEIKTKDGETDNSDLYGLTGFFPCTAPLLINATTKSLWPVPEYFQLMDILDDVHGIVQRMFLLTRAIRVRFLFDSSISQLKSLVGEAGEGVGLGIPNLQNMLIEGKNTLAKLVAYFPTDEMIQGLQNMYTAFQQRLDMFYQASGMSDLIRGQTNPDSDKTYGERQMEGKFALNRIEPFQRQMQEWIKNNYELAMEMGLKLFSDETIDEYITPQTLDREDQQRYEPALELLRNNRRRRFRVDFETDSTIAINEQWRKERAIETANTISKLIESIAGVAETQPELAGVELKLAEHIVGELTDGKLFIDEIQDSLSQIIDRVSQPKSEQPNYDLEKLKLESSKIGAEMQFKNLELQAKTSLEYSKLSQESQQSAIDAQLKQLELNIKSGASQTELYIALTEVREKIAQGWAALNLSKETLLSQIQSEVSKKELEQLKIVLDSRVKAKEITLQEAEQALRAFEVQVSAQSEQVSLQERIATEQRLQAEHETDNQLKQVESAAMMMEAMKPEPEKAAPLTLDMSKTVHVKMPDKGKKK